jgi:Predicted membrane protein
MSTVLAMLIAAASGVLLGTVTGLIPGLHVNTIGFLLLAATATVAQPPVVIAAAILAAGITHTYLSIVPGLVLGVPEAATVVGALPGHRMVLQGAGPEAIRLSAIGSGVALVVAAALALPLAQLIGEHHTLFRRAVPALIALIAAILIISEQTTRGRIGGLCCMLLAVGFGQLTLELPTSGGLLPAGMVSILGPIFSGLFGAPILIDALATGGQIPQQRDGSLQISPGAAVRAATSGALGGAMVGFLPGVSAGVASIIALGGVGGSTTPGAETDRRYIIATSGADTSTAVFALASLVVIGSPRSGITIALEQLGGGPPPPRSSHCCCCVSWRPVVPSSCCCGSANGTSNRSGVSRGVRSSPGSCCSCWGWRGSSPGWSASVSSSLRRSSGCCPHGCTPDGCT